MADTDWPTRRWELKDHIRFTFVSRRPEPEARVAWRGEETGFAKEGAILTPRQVVGHYKDKLKDNLMAMAKSQVDKMIDDKADALSLSLDNPLDATLVDGYVYAPDLPYGLTNSLKKKGGIFTGLAKVGTTFNRARTAYALNFLRAERQLGMLQAMRDEIRRLKYQDKAFDVSGKWAMVAQPWSYLDFGTGQLNAKLTSRSSADCSASPTWGRKRSPAQPRSPRWWTDLAGRIIGQSQVARMNEEAEAERSESTAPR